MRMLIFILTCLGLAIPCQAEVIISFPMDTEPGWTTEGQWEFGVPQGGGGPYSYDPTSGYTGSNVYGYNLAGNYADNMPQYYLTTSALDCGLAENVTLCFWRWLGVESSTYDHARIQVSNNGTDWTDVWANGGGDLVDSSWVYCEYDISAVADNQPTVYVRWCMGPTDFSGAYAGWNIDDVSLEGDVTNPLFISSNDGFFSFGPEGGPFNPPCKSYTLTNEGSTTLNWTASGTQSWVEAEPNNGTLLAGESVPVQICISADANALAEGKYEDTVNFTNTGTVFSHNIDVLILIGDFAGNVFCVPIQYPTIQAGINASSNGDTVIVLDGTYSGVGNYEIEFNGKAITLKSENGPGNCIIICDLTPPYYNGGFNFGDGEGPNSVLEGFTISYAGTGIVCAHSSSPTIRNCIIRNCLFSGMYCRDSKPTLIGCTFRENFNFDGAGGMLNRNSRPLLINCVFTENSGGTDDFDDIACGGMWNWLNSSPTLINCVFSNNFGWKVGGMYNKDSSNPMLINCTFSGNSNPYGGRGMYNSNSNPTVKNCIFWDNGISGGAPVITYSDIEGGWPGEGNINLDPCFADSNNGDFHLKSQVGRWNPNTNSWVTDANTSDCIDAGDPNSDWTAELWPHGRRINMGAYGGTPEASMSPLGIGNIADLNNDDCVDYRDLNLSIGEWLNEEVLLKEDLDRDGFIDLRDFCIFGENWRWEQ